MVWRDCSHHVKHTPFFSTHKLKQNGAGSTEDLQFLENWGTIAPARSAFKHFFAGTDVLCKNFAPHAEFPPRFRQVMKGDRGPWNRVGGPSAKARQRTGREVEVNARWRRRETWAEASKVFQESSTHLQARVGRRLGCRMVASFRRKVRLKRSLSALGIVSIYATITPEVRRWEGGRLPRVSPTTAPSFRSFRYQFLPFFPAATRHLDNSHFVALWPNY